jgi:hypothetical protein
MVLPRTTDKHRTMVWCMRRESSTSSRSPGAPVPYGPCQPIQVYVNDDIAPNGTEDLVEQAVDAVSMATRSADGHRRPYPRPTNLVGRTDPHRRLHCWSTDGVRGLDNR